MRHVRALCTTHFTSFWLPDTSSDWSTKLGYRSPAKSAVMGLCWRPESQVVHVHMSSTCPVRIDCKTEN